MEGIDIYSKFQTVTSWNQVRSADVRWCYQKVSDGTTTRSVQSPQAGHAAGVLQGGYHFSQVGSPVGQANLLVDRCTSLGMLDLNPALDLEDNPTGSSLPNIPDSQKADWAIAFGRQVHARGHGFTLYANDSTWGLVKTKVMNALPSTFRWVARYRTAPPNNPYDAWQYTSSGSVPGISAGSVDRSRGAIPTNKGVQDMPLTTQDLDAIMQRFYDWRDGDGRNLNDQGRQNGWWIQGATTSINALRDLIIADDANDVTAEAVANATKAAIAGDVVQAIEETLANVTVDATLSAEDRTAISAELAANLSNRLLN